MSPQLLLTLIAVLSGLHTIAMLAHVLKLDGLVAAQLEKIGDAAVAKAATTADPADDARAAAESAVMHAAAQLVRDGKVGDGIATIEALAKHAAVSK